MPEIARSIRNYNWENLSTLESVRYTCGYCAHLVSSEKGWRLHDRNNNQRNGVFICPDCLCPTFHYPDEKTRVPDSPFGQPIDNLPEDHQALYEEARTCTANNCHTSAVLVLRKC